MSDIVFETVGRAALVTLNRPKALNSLSEAMVREMGEALDEWAGDDRVQRVVIRGEGKAFCAGGDIRDIYERRAAALGFFAAEYLNNHRIATYPKPYVALIDGIVMGGGVGVSVHGSHRVGTEATRFAMPEVGIGLFPDVGVSHVLSRMEGEAGLWLALSGTQIGRDEAAALGVLTHPTRTERLGEALDRAAHARDLDRALDELAEAVPPRDSAQTSLVAQAFAADDVRGVLSRLDAAGGAFAEQTAAAIGAKSPTSLEITFRQIRRASGRSVADCLRTDFRIVSRILEGHDLYEGIRAVLVDKDNAPRWSPSTLEAVDADEVEAHFDPLPDGDLPLAATEGTA